MRIFRSQFARVAGIVLALAILLSFGVGIASMVTYKPYGVPDSRREEYDEKLAEIALRKELKAEAEKNRLGIAFVEENEFNFGFLDAQTTNAEHAFRIENHGEGDLLLEPAGSSCKCTVAKLENPVVLPGEHAMVKVIWNVGSDLVDDFEQTALIKTNDPTKPQIELTVRGRVATEWAYSGPIVGAQDVAVGEPSTGSTLLYSQTFTDMIVLEAEASSKSITITTEPVTDNSLSVHRAKSGVKLVATYHPTHKEKSFQNNIRVHLFDPDTEKESWLEIPFRGKFRKPVRFYGPEIWNNGGLNLGTVELGSEQTWAFFARFHVDHDIQEAVIVEVKPEGLAATIEPIKRLKNTFRVEVRLADDAKPVQFDFKDQGYVNVADKNDLEMSNWLPLHGRIISRVED